jgi:phage I-like protein
MKKEVAKLMETLGISEKEAIEVIEFDKGNIDNEEVEQIEQKEKEAQKDKKPKKGSSLDKVKHQKAKKKIDENKEKIMSTISKMITENASLFIAPKDITPSKITFKDKDGNYYSISLTKHKTAPDGYIE